MTETRADMSSGIYQIKNQANGKRYIGSTINFAKRWQNHLGALRRRQHRNPHLQAAFERYSEVTFVFAVLEQVKPDNLIEREQHYLDMLVPEYNLSSTAGSCLGCHASEEARRKQSEAKLGRRNPNWGKPLSEQTKRRISRARKGTSLSKETKQRVSESWTPERKQRHKAVRSGEGNPNYGKHPSAETLMKISGERNHMYGKQHSAEIRAKMRMAWTPERREAQSKRMAAMNRERRITNACTSM